MNDYEEQMFGGTPQITDEMREQFRLEAEASKNRRRQLPTEQSDTPQEQAPQATAKEQPVVNQTEPKAQEQPAADKPQTEKPPEPSNTVKGLSPEALALANRRDAFGQGLIDAGADFLNLLPFVNAPKTARYEDDIAEGVRNITQLVAPMLLMGQAVGPLTKGAAAYKGVGQSILRDKGFQNAGKFFFSGGTGALSDYAAKFNEEDDNLSGFLKKNWPSWWGWIPDDIATLDDDHPNVKKRKNVTEGFGLGIGTDFILGAARLLRGMRGISRITQYIPENEKAEKWFAKHAIEDETSIDVVERNAKRRSEALDELGQYNFDKAVDFDEPILGYHDVYGYLEQGTRTADPGGIVIASVDSLRLVKDSSVVDGRVGSVITESALKKGLESGKEMEIVIRGQAEILKDAGQYGYKTAAGENLTFKQVIDNGNDIAASLFNFNRTDFNAFVKRVRDFQETNVQKVKELTDEGYAGVFKAIKLYMDEYTNMDYIRAQAWIGQSMSGQVSDMAQGVRLLAETRAVERAQEQILDRVEFLLAQKGITSYYRGRALNMLNLWNRMTVRGDDAFKMAEAKRIDNIIKNEENPTLAAIERIKREAGNTADTLRALNSEKPELLAPLIMAYEFTDGSIDSITKLNNYVKNSTGFFRKILIDRQPEIPSAVVQGMYATLYNNTLSAFATPIKAGLSSAVLLAEKPVAAFAGAARTKDMQALKKAWYVYTSGIQETLTDSLKYMGHVFKKSATDPYVVAVRQDQGDKLDRTLQVINAVADTYAEKGDYGPQVMAELVNNLQDVANSPFMRFGNRSMQALDGFVGSFVAVAEAKSEAWERVTKGGKLQLDKARANELAQDVKAKMFDENGLITDEAVKYASGEINLNLDSDFNTSLSGLIRRAPILKPFLLFTKTPLNEIAVAAQRTPLGLFFNQFNKFKLPAKDMSGPEVERLLKERGVKVPAGMDPMRKYDEIRRELLGRKAMGALYVSAAIGLVFSDRLHGHGNYNRQVQKTRREAGWKPMSIVGLDGVQVSIENMGPFSNWLGLIADIADHYDSLSPRDIGELLKKMMFVFASSITEKTSLAALEPFTDIITGNLGAANKWGASFLTAASVPGSSQLAEISRLMDPGLKEVDLQLHQLVMNRNPISKGLLPVRYDWIDGGEVGVPDNFLARIWNTYMPWKINGKISDRKQFLIDIEYDGRPAVNTNGKGVVYTPEERSELLNIIGKNELFKKEIDEIIARVEAAEGAEGFRTRMQEALADPHIYKSGALDVGEFESLHMEIDSAIRKATKYAAADLSTHSDISKKQHVQNVVRDMLQAGDVGGASEYMDYVENPTKFKEFVETQNNKRQ